MTKRAATPRKATARKAPVDQAAPAAPAAPEGMMITWDALERFNTKKHSEVRANPFRMEPPPPGVGHNGGPAMDSALAMDSDPALSDMYAWAGAGQIYGEGMEWLGWPVLSALSVLPEYKRLAESRSQELVRRWGHPTYSGDEDKATILSGISEEMDRLSVRDVFRECADIDGYFGRAQIVPDLGTNDIPGELLKPLAKTPDKVGLGSLKRLVVLEPCFTYPGVANYSDPLHPDFYNPPTWWSYGRELSRTRVITMVSCPVPRMLRPAFQHAGISLSQRARPFVDEWTRARKFVSAIIEKYSITALKTDLSKFQGSLGVQLEKRLEFFSRVRDATGILAIDGATEDLINVSVPLAGLGELLDQIQARIAFIDGQPPASLFGQAPAGLGATGEGERLAWQDRIGSLQVSFFGPALKEVLDLIMLSKFGKIFPGVGWEWASLQTPDPMQVAQIQKVKAETGQILIGDASISPDDERERVARDDESGYSNLDLNAPVEAPEDNDGADPDDGADGPGGRSGEQETSPAPVSGAAAEPDGISQVSLNGAQITALVGIISQVGSGQLPRESAITLMTTAFPITTERAEAIMGTVGKGFVPALPDTPVAG